MSLNDLGGIAIMALAVYLPKVLPLLLVSDHLPTAVQRWLVYVAPAVLAALIAPAILLPGREIAVFRTEWLAFGATLLVAILTRRMLPSVAAGLLAMGGIVAARMG